MQDISYGVCPVFWKKGILIYKGDDSKTKRSLECKKNPEF